MVDKVIQILQSKYLISPIHYEGIQRKEELEYPESALREAILNLIVHKNYAGTTIQLSVYDDKLILWNPGALPQELSIEQLKKRNMLLTLVIKTLPAFFLKLAILKPGAVAQTK
jgi:ATP-dependent DNA helicase RecG